MLPRKSFPPIQLKRSPYSGAFLGCCVDRSQLDQFAGTCESGRASKKLFSESEGMYWMNMANVRQWFQSLLARLPDLTSVPGVTNVMFSSSVQVCCVCPCASKMNRSWPLLRLTFTAWLPYLTAITKSDGKRSIGGPVGKVLDAISTSMNFEYEASIPPDGHIGVRLSNGSWTGIVGSVQRQEADMSFVPIIESYERSMVGNFGPPLFFVPFGILSATGESESNVFGYILTFDWKVWALTMCAIPILAFLLALSAATAGTIQWRKMGDRTHYYGWELFRNLLYESSPVNHTSISSSILLTSWFMGCLVIANSFAGHLKSSMAIKNPPQRIDSARDVVARPHLRPIIWKGSYYESFLSTSKIPLHQQLWSMVQKNKGTVFGRDMYSDDNLEQVLLGKAVIMVEQLSLQYRIAGYCSRYNVQGFYFAREPIDENRLSFLFSKKFPPRLFRAMRTRISWLYEGGLIDKWISGSLGNWQRCVRTEEGPRAVDLTLQDMKASFVLWALVIGMASLSFVAEVIVAQHAVKNRTVPRNTTSKRRGKCSRLVLRAQRPVRWS